MADYTSGTQMIGMYNAGSLPTPRRIILIGAGVTLEQGATFTSTGASVVGAISLQLSWTIPAGTTNLTIPLNYASTLNVSGARPYARLRSNSAIGLAEQTVVAPSGGGAQTISLTFAATSADGTAVIDLVVPNSGIVGTVAWSPVVQSGQSASIGPSGSSGGNGGGGAGIKGQSSNRIYEASTTSEAHYQN